MNPAAGEAPRAFFGRDGEWFRPTSHSRGPWDPDACHAGPPTGLLARAAESAVPDQRLVRITVDLTRPVPFAGFRLVTEVLHSGRRVSTAQVTMFDGDDRRVVTARTLHMAERPETDHPTAAWNPPTLSEATDGPFPSERTGHGLPLFRDAATFRYPPGEDSSPGPTTAWMRTVALLADEEPSGFQRLCPLADCGNAISRNATMTVTGAINADLTIVVHREPQGEWFGSQSVSHWQPDGIGMSDSLLFDQHGAVGRAIQTLVVDP